MESLQSLLYRAISSEYEAIQIYKEAFAYAMNIGNAEIAAVFDEISHDEMAHIGNLIKSLDKFLPEDYKIYSEKLLKGEQEFENTIKTAIEDCSITTKELSESSKVDTSIDVPEKAKVFVDLLQSFGVNYDDMRKQYIDGKFYLTVPKGYLGIKPNEVWMKCLSLRNNLKDKHIFVLYNRDTLTIIIENE